MATTIVAARIDDEVKRRADKVLAAAQLTPTQLVRRVYDYLATVGDVPEFVKVDESCVVLDVEDPVLRQHFLARRFNPLGLRASSRAHPRGRRRDIPHDGIR